MPLTPVQLDGIERLMNVGNGTEDSPRGVQQLLSELCQRRNDVLDLTSYHDVELEGTPVIDDTTATALLGQLKSRLHATALELAALLK